MSIQLTHARLVLRDAAFASGLLVDGVTAEQWRVAYYSISSLLRSVGYVLNNVEAPRSELLRKIVRRKYDELKTAKPEPAIYWHFIESERNLLLKEYTSSARWSFEIFTPTARDDDGKLSLSGPTTQKWSYDIVRGHFAGRCQRELVQEAIDWWGAYIDEIEREASSYAG